MRQEITFISTKKMSNWTIHCFDNYRRNDQRLEPNEKAKHWKSINQPEFLNLTMLHRTSLYRVANLIMSLIHSVIYYLPGKEQHKVKKVKEVLFLCHMSFVKMVSYISTGLGRGEFCFLACCFLLWHKMTDNALVKILIIYD